MRFCKINTGRTIWHLAVSGAAILSFAILAGVGSASAATCTDATFKGVYGFFTSGFEGSEPVANIGQVTSTGSGTITGTITHSLEGAVETASISGTYTFAKGCTGTLTYTEGSATYNYSFTLDNSNKAVQAMETDSGATVVGFVEPLDAATCGLSGTSKTYAFSAFGADKKEAVGYVGELVLNGKGSITGTISFSVKGTINTDIPVTGSYTQAADCIGTVTLSPTGFSTIDFATYAVNENKELLMVETSSGATVGGNIQ
jgi:VCBS repeat-containing protein